MQESSVIFITGANSGFGLAMTKEALSRGYRVFATARHLEELSDVVKQGGDAIATATLDVTNLQQIEDAVSKAVEYFGQIDVLHNNAGYGQMGGLEEVSIEQVRQQFDVNFFGAFEVMRAVLKHMRDHKSGHILNMSSIAGQYARSGYGIYAASKFALEAVSETLHYEAEPLGIKVTIVEPSGFRTDFHGRSLKTNELDIKDYAQTAGQATKGQRSLDGKQDGDPALAAKAMLDVVEMDDPPLRLPLGNDAVDLMHDKLKLVREDLERMESVARGADSAVA